jgi:hypothetical protein
MEEEGTKTRPLTPAPPTTTPKKKLKTKLPQQERNKIKFQIPKSSKYITR